MAEETPEERIARWRSVGFVPQGRKPMEKIITRPERGDPALGENTLDAGKRAKLTINADRDIVTTTSDNRQDANIFGTPAVASGEGAEQ